MSAKADPRYAIIGNGRLARHLCHYFSLLHIPSLQLTRLELQTARVRQGIERVLLAVSDRAIEEVAVSLRDIFPNALFVHFSGTIVSPLAESAHPLMTFSSTLYDLKTYEQIPFVTENGRSSFQELFPELINPATSLDPKQKALYHALCVTGGNFTQILWAEVLKSAQTQLGIPTEFFRLFAETSLKNAFDQGEKALTGPLVRGDHITISRHQIALREHPVADLYQAFVDHFQHERTQ